MDYAPAVRPSVNEITIKPDKSSMPTEHEMMVYHAMAQQAITSKMYGNNYKDASGVLMVMLSARELGIPPMQALNGGLNLIGGKVEISARMMSALIRKAGHLMRVIECSEHSCTVAGTRCDTGETQTASFSVAEAQKAGLVKPGSGWTKWPKDMCYARAMSRLARQLFSDVIGIGYVEGEIKDQPDLRPVIEELPFIEEKPVVDENEMVNKYISLFDLDDAAMAAEYLKAVQNHHGWGRIEAIQKLMADEKLLKDAFHKWKNKFKKVDTDEKIIVPHGTTLC